MFHCAPRVIIVFLGVAKQASKPRPGLLIRDKWLEMSKHCFAIMTSQKGRPMTPSHTPYSLDSI